MAEFSKSIAASEAEVIVGRDDDGTGYLEVAEWAVEGQQTADAQTVLTAAEMRRLARTLLEAADALDGIED